MYNEELLSSWLPSTESLYDEMWAQDEEESLEDVDEAT